MPASVDTVAEALVASLGVEPQVVTLALDALRERGFPIRYVYVVHTNPSFRPIGEALRRLQAEVSHYADGRPPVDFAWIPVQDGADFPEDLVTEAEAGLFLRVLYRTVRDLKRSGHRVHLLIAGGRKVMAAYTMVIAQLLLDDTDAVWHLLSEERLLQSKAMHADDPGQTVLVRVPVLRWSLLPSTIRELLVWDDPYRAIRHQQELRDRQRWQLLHAFWERLTPAERSVVRALVETHGTTKEIARSLGRDPKTVAHQLESAYAKYRSCVGLAPGTRVRTRLIADLTPVLSSLVGPNAHARMGLRPHARRKRTPKTAL